MIEQMKKDDYEVFKLPKSVNSVCTTFPFSSVFSLSIATWRVPSRLGEFLQVEKSTRTYFKIVHLCFAFSEEQINSLSND